MVSPRLRVSVPSWFVTVWISLEYRIDMEIE